MATVLAPDSWSSDITALFAAGVSVIGAVTFAMMIYMGALVAAPYRQRNEARRLARRAVEKDRAQQLIRVTPNQGSGSMPTGQGNTVSEIDAYLDVETIDQGRPLRNCRVKLLELEHYFAWTDRGTREAHESWVRDHFYQGQTYFFSWSGRPDTAEAVDVHRSERASIAKCVGTRPELTTTVRPAGHLFHGDQYHLKVEVTADNSLPLVKEYRLQLYQGNQTIIEEWDDSRTTWR